MKRKTRRGQTDRALIRELFRTLNARLTDAEIAIGHIYTTLSLHTDALSAKDAPATQIDPSLDMVEFYD